MRGTETFCAECGKPFYAQASALRRSRKYCSRKCYFARSRKSPAAQAAETARLKVTRKGSGNPAWKGQDTEGSIYRVFNLRLKGETCCRACGGTNALALHHAIPRSMCKAARRDLRNGLTLCGGCHQRWHTRTLTIYRDIFTADEWAFISTCELLGQRIDTWLSERYPPRPADWTEPRYRIPNDMRDERY